MQKDYIPKTVETVCSMNLWLKAAIREQVNVSNVVNAKAFVRSSYRYAACLKRYQRNSTELYDKEAVFLKKKNTQNTKKKIVSAAWKLFYEQGYNGTTIDDIVSESGTSKGSFYHYFSCKDDLLSSLAYLFDEKYEELRDVMPDQMSSVQKMLFLNKELFRMIDNSISIDLLTQLLSSQLITKNEKSLLDRNRTYFRLLRQIVTDGLFERALLYDWCLCNGEYSLSDYSSKMLPMFLNGYLSGG